MDLYHAMAFFRNLPIDLIHPLALGQGERRGESDMPFCVIAFILVHFMTSIYLCYITVPADIIVITSNTHVIFSC